MLLHYPQNKRRKEKESVYPLMQNTLGKVKKPQIIIICIVYMSNKK